MSDVRKLEMADVLLGQEEREMQKLDSTTRILNTFAGKPLDRLPIFDIIHNVEFIEHVTGAQVTPANAEDLVCQAARQNLDLVRHFCIPDDLETRVVSDADGFQYRCEWWTRETIRRPIHSMEDVLRLVHSDIEAIHRCLAQGKLCHQAKEQLNLLGEKYDYPEEVNRLFERLTAKLDGTMMIAPETVPGLYTATNRYGFEWFVYLYHDYPDLALQYYDALVEHELFRIDAFAPTGLSRVALISEATASNTGLLWSPAFVRKVILPRVKKCVDRWKKYGYYVIMHSDGNKWSLIQDFIDLGADSVNPCEPLATMEVKRFRERYPDTVIGSMIDCQDLLAYGAPEEIRRKTIQAIEDSGGARTLIGSTSEIHPQIKVENALAMYETARNYWL
jgi:hypothetical protein